MLRPKFIDWAILALGTALRTLMMWLPLTGDEADSFLWFVTKPVANIMRVYDLPTNHILHSIITHFSCQIFGLSERAVRLPVFLAGVGLIALVWYAGQLVADVRVARLAALFTSCSTVLCYYSQSARGYSIGAFLAMAVAIIAYKWPQRRVLTALALGSFACLYNNPSALIFVVPLLVWLWTEEKSITTLACWIASLTAVAYWPLTIYAPMWAHSHAELKFDGWYQITETLRMCSQGLMPVWVLCGLLALGIRQVPRAWTLLVWAAVATLGYHWVPALAFSRVVGPFCSRLSTSSVPTAA